MLLPLFLIALLLAPRVPPRPRPAPPVALPTAIFLTVKTGGKETRASVQPRQASPAARPVAVLKAGETPSIRWSVRNTHPKNPITNVVVHFLITRQDASGAPIPERPQKGSVVDTVFGTSIRANDVTAGSYETPVEEPGSYLVEVELLDPQGNRRNYCAVDLTVE